MIAPDVAGIYAMLARTCPERREEFRHRAHTARTSSAMATRRRWSTYRGRTQHWRDQPRDERGRFIKAAS